MKQHHFLYLAIIVIGVAIVSGLLLYFTSLRFVFTTDPNSSVKKTPSMKLNEAEVKVDFVEVDPETPIAIPTGTVGGVTACERFDNIKSCLKTKNPILAETISDIIATEGATIEGKCSSVLSQILPYRVDSIKSGCIW